MLVVMVMVAIIAACGTQPTAAPNPTTAPTETPETAETEAESAPLLPDVIADTLPCPATIIDSDETTLSIRFREPTDDAALMIGAVRPNMAIRIDQMREREGVTWYRTINPGTNTPFGWVQAGYIVLSEDCVTGGAEEIATEESD